MKIIINLIIICFLYSCNQKINNENCNIVDSAKTYYIPDVSLDKKLIILKYDNLSNEFNYKLKILKKIENEELVKIVKIEIKNKYDSLIQLVISKPDYIFCSSFLDSLNVRSYSTNINEKKQVVDNDYGFFIIADFNFDYLDDFALMSFESGNGGPIYEYYIQCESKNFKKDSFLTTEMQYFPEKIDYKNKLLITRVRANVNGVNVNYYKYNSENKNWILLKKEALFKYIVC